MRTKFDIKNRWNQMLMDEINKKIQKRIQNNTNNNQKSKDRIWYKNKMIGHLSTLADQYEFKIKEREMREKKKEKIIKDSLSLHHWHTGTIRQSLPSHSSIIV